MKKNKKIEKDKKLNMRSDKIEKVTIIFASKNVYTKVKTGVIKKIFQLNGSTMSILKISIEILT